MLSNEDKRKAKELSEQMKAFSRPSPKKEFKINKKANLDFINKFSAVSPKKEEEKFVSKYRAPEVAEPDTPEDIAAKLNTLEGVIKARVIEGIPTPQDIVNAIKDLKGNERIDISHIRNGETLARLASSNFNMNDQRWHGGGLIKVSHDNTLSGDGTPTNPLSASAEVSNPALPFTSVQYNNSGSFGGFGTFDGTYFNLPNGQAFRGQYSNLNGTAFINPDGSAVFAGGTVIISNIGNISATNLSGTNTGDNATNSQYSGLAASKQDTLISGTNIKTINGSTILGSGNLTTTSGTVTSVSIVSANGFGGTVTNSTSTPAITLTTSVVGLIKGNGTAISAAVDGTDYLSPTTGITVSQGTPQTLGSTGSRLTKLWATDITVTNAITGSITGNAATVTTNANLTGPITSSGNATAITSQTGTGSTFAMSVAPAFTGTPTAPTPATSDSSTTIPTTAFVQANKIGYMLTAEGNGGLAPANATTYFFGALYSASPTVTATTRRVYIAKTGVVKSATIWIRNSGTLSTTETSTMSFRLNNTTDTTLSSAIQNNAVSQEYTVTGLSIAVTQGDYFEIKWVTPTWSTPPGAFVCNVQVYIEN